MNQYNFPQPCYNSFYYQYQQQHAMMSYFIQKLHSNIHYNSQPSNLHNPVNAYNELDCSSSCSSCSCCSCCSPGSCSSSSEYEEVEEMDSEEGYDEEQYQNEEYDEDESECEYEFNVDAILAMRAAKEELKKKEMLESKDGESSDSKDDEYSDSKSDKESKSDDKDSKSDSIVFVDSDKEDFEIIDLSSTKISDCKLYSALGGFNKTEEEFNRRYVMKTIYGERGSQTVLGLEAAMHINFERLYDKEQPSLWPVLPLRL